jgi:arginase
MSITRRTWLAAAAALSFPFDTVAAPRRALDLAIDLIEAPNNLGLRPPRDGAEPGTWRAPAVLDAAGLAQALRPSRHVRLDRPPYTAKEVAGTRIRNGTALRTFALGLAAEVERSLRAHALPVVIGGDCSSLLGCLAGLRHAGGRGLVHVDGHSDFSHPGNYDARAVLGAAAGMDLALATGRGEPTLTAWPEIRGPLADDRDTVQLGEREDIASYRDLARSAITRLPIADVQRAGIAAAAARVVAHLEARALDRAWLHIDLDVLDQAVMPAVDSPGSPGLTFDQLADLGRALVRSGRIAGLDVAIYDPDLDPDARWAPKIVACIAAMLDA